MSFVQDDALKTAVKEFGNDGFHSDSSWGNHFADCYLSKINKISPEAA